MLPLMDETHDSQLRSWVSDANGHSDFPIQNLPLGIFRPRGEGAQAGIAIGNHILSLHKLAHSGLLSGDAQVACNVSDGESLNGLLGLGASYRVELRRSVSKLLAAGAAERPELLHHAPDCELLMPASVGDYTDFYAGIHHAQNVGALFRPENPLLPNYKWVPIGYHGRSSSIRTSGVPVIRPKGQRKPAAESTPSFGPARNLDFELELGIWVGPGNRLGERISIDAADQSIAGYCLLNDWSARDIQSWEYQPLGPFLAKSFHTTISSWIVTPEALAPFRAPQAPRPADDPQPLPYLCSEQDQQLGALSIELEVLLNTTKMRHEGLAAYRLTTTNTRNMYWTPAQLLTHHASNGCNLSPGDLLGTGTISSATQDGFGSLLELTKGGKEPVTLSSGEQRRFLEDGDEVIFRARAQREGFAPIGFGECRAIVSAPTD